MAILKTVTLVRGEDRTFIFKLTYTKNGEPFNLSGYTSSYLKFKNADGTILSLTGSVSSTDLAKLSFTMTDTQSTALMLGRGQDMQLEINRGTTKTLKKLENILNVIDPLS